MNKNILNSPLQQLRRMAMTLASIVAVVAVGTGNDWVRTFGISNRYQDSLWQQRRPHRPHRPRLCGSLHHLHACSQQRRHQPVRPQGHGKHSEGQRDRELRRHELSARHHTLGQEVAHGRAPRGYRQFLRSVALQARWNDQLSHAVWRVWRQDKPHEPAVYHPLERRHKRRHRVLRPYLQQEDSF